MEGEDQKLPDTQEVKPELGDVDQDSQQSTQESSVGSETSPPPTGGSTPPEKPKRSKKKKIIIGLVLIIILIIFGYGGFLAFTYWKCTKVAPETCEVNSCSFSLTGFNLATETKENCCGNTKCEIGETSSDCASDCPSCDDESDCTKDSYNYNSQRCVYEQLFAPCYVRAITLGSATPESSYQINVKLTASNFDYSRTMANGEDIRFFDEEDNPLNFWVEEWNKEGESGVWVKVENAGTEKIYMSYGYPDANSASDTDGVFDFFEGFDYEDESKLLKVWSKHGSPEIELTDGIVTIATSGTKEDEEHGGQHIYKDLEPSVLFNNIFEMSVKRFSGHQSHMANIGYTSSSGGSISDGDCWAVSRYSPSLEGSYVVFGGNHGSIASSPIDSFNTITIYHRGGISTAYEPPGTKVAQYNWPSEPPPGGYILLGGATTISGTGKASYDWLRVRKYASEEPSVTLGGEETASESSQIKNLYESLGED